jgi:hypothetical protein
LANSSPPPFVFVNGPLRSEFFVQMSPLLTQSLSLDQVDSVSSRSLHMDLWPDMQSALDNSLIVTVQANINNSKQFFTDVNGLYLIERTYTEYDCRSKWS